MTDWLTRTELILDKGMLEKLKNADVLVVGLGGAGAMSYMPAAFGIACESVVICDLTGISRLNTI